MTDEAQIVLIVTILVKYVEAGAAAAEAGLLSAAPAPFLFFLVLLHLGQIVLKIVVRDVHRVV